MNVPIYNYEAHSDPDVRAARSNSRNCPDLLIFGSDDRVNSKICILHDKTLTGTKTVQEKSLNFISSN